MNHYKSVLPKVIEDKDCERELDNMYGCINKALKKADPKSKATIVDRNNPWWNMKLKQQRNKVCKLYQKTAEKSIPD